MHRTGGASKASNATRLGTPTGVGELSVLPPWWRLGIGGRCLVRYIQIGGAATSFADMDSQLLGMASPDITRGHDADAVADQADQDDPHLPGNGRFVNGA